MTTNATGRTAMRNRGMRALLLSGALMTSLIACGGSQTPSDSIGEENAGEGRRGRNRGAADDGPQLTPEEIEAQRLATLQAEADAAFTEVVTLWEEPPEDRNYRRMYNLLEEVYEKDSSNLDALFNIGALKQEEGDLDGAREAYQRVTDLDPSYARGLAAIGFLQLEEGDVDGARSTFEACVERREIEPGCRINLAVLELAAADAAGHLETSTADAAVAHLRFALGGDARNGDAYANLAKVYFDVDQLVLSRLVCENAILQGINAAALHNRLGLIALAEDDVIEAYAEFQLAVELAPQYAEAHMNIGAMALSFRDYAVAKSSFEVVLAQTPDSIDAQLSYGVALRGLEDYDGAETQYCAVLETEPNHLGALLNLGLLYEEFMMDYETSIGFYDRYLAAPGGRSTPVAPDVDRRRGVNAELLEVMIEFGEYEAPTRRPMCPPSGS